MRTSPTVATTSPMRRASSRRASAKDAAARKASRRPGIGSVPAWPLSPWKRTTKPAMPVIEVTAASGIPARSSTGPCSTCTSTKLPGSGARGPRSPVKPSAESAARTLVPALSIRSSSASQRRPQTKRLPNTPRPKRYPSSSRKTQTVSVARNSSPASRLAAASAASTPSAPSKRPPPGTVSRCEPDHTSGASGSVPRRRPKRLPAASQDTSRPASAIHEATSSQACCSARPRPARVTPQPGPAPIRASCSSRSISQRS